jgi:hypothetical protein
MKILKTKTFFVCLGMLAGLLLVVAPGIVLACVGGAAGLPEPPGGGCSEDYEYILLPPPYRGNVTFFFDEGDICMFGRVEQVGNSDCYMEIVESDPYCYVSGLTSEQFNSLRAGNLAGQCFQNVPVNQGGGCAAMDFWQIMGAGQMVFGPYDDGSTQWDSFQANVIIMTLSGF